MTVLIILGSRQLLAPQIVHLLQQGVVHLTGNSVRSGILITELADSLDHDVFPPVLSVLHSCEGCTGSRLLVSQCYDIVTASTYAQSSMDSSGHSGDICRPQRLR